MRYVGTDLARLNRDVAEDRKYVRAGMAMIAYSLALFVLGYAVTSMIYMGIVLVSLSATFFLFGLGATIVHAVRAATGARHIRMLTRLPTARLVR